MENPVLFGVLDVEVQQQQGVYDNVCFGKAFWLAESPSQEQLKCGICGEVCFLIVQSKNQIDSVLQFRSLYSIKTSSV